MTVSEMIRGTGEAFLCIACPWLCLWLLLGLA